MTFFFVSNVASSVLTAIFPSKKALPMHHIFKPLSFIPAPVTPLVNSEALHLVVYELPLETAAILPLKFALPMLLAV